MFKTLRINYNNKEHFSSFSVTVRQEEFMKCLGFLWCRKISSQELVESISISFSSSLAAAGNQPARKAAKKLDVSKQAAAP